ncbi:uncharacterized protein LOC135848107 [Planococcus citri]|uniref:uncharacterized protein LOC135848107 n=1 Tax=Planococcus citri TaxID=170843 RepID=UPI0031F97535
MEGKMFLCDKCDRRFQYKANLYRHSSDKHGKGLRLREKIPHACASCEFKSYRKKELIRHIRRNHSSSTSSLKSRMKCPLCDTYVISYQCLYQHISQLHNIPIEEEELEFKNETEFLTWKMNVEKETQNHYRAQRGARKKQNCFLREYVCHRSYNPSYVVKDTERKRAKKSPGSNKMGAVCPAKMVVKIEPDKVLVNFVRCHVGHSHDVIRMRLFDHERAEIAEKASRGLTVKRILQEARESVDPNSSERMRNLKRKDVYNTIRDFGIDYARAKANSNETLETTEPSVENEYEQIHEPINSTHDDSCMRHKIVEPEAQLIEASITGPEELKEKLQLILGLVDNIPEDNIEIVSKKLDEIMVYFANEDSKEISNCETSPHKMPVIKTHEKCAIPLEPAQEEIWIEIGISAIEEIEIGDM